MTARDPVLSLRQLNRALLSRQMLLRRARVAPATAIERVGALQAQWQPAPYVALWSRLARFTVADLEEALHDRSVVKATVMRGTLHLVSAADYPAYTVAVPEARRALWPSTQRQLLAAMAREIPEARMYVKAGGTGIADPEALHREMLAFAKRPRERAELVDLIVRSAKIPAPIVEHLVWGFVAAFGHLVHEPEGAHWATRRRSGYVAARSVLRGMKLPTFADAVAHTVRRHLAAFGPATVGDISSWTSIRTPPIREALESLGRSVRTFRDERDRVLYDLARAPRPAADTPAPPRLLPKWDSAILAYEPRERARILPPSHGTLVILKNGDVAQTFLIDGFVAGTWALRPGADAVVELRPFARLKKADAAALLGEGESYARFAAPDARAHGARIAL